MEVTPHLGKKLTRKEFETRLIENGINLIPTPPKTNLIEVIHDRENFRFITRFLFQIDDEIGYISWVVQEDDFENLFTELSLKHVLSNIEMEDGWK